MQDANDRGWSDACMCKRNNGDYTNTGALQLASDGDDYNGYDLCWDGNCGTDAI